MEKVLILAIISALVAVAVRFVLARQRNFYFFAAAVMLGGLLIGVCGHRNSKIGYEEYVRIEVQIQKSEFSESEEHLRLYANGSDYILPRPNISDLDAVKQEGPKLNGAVTIWLRSYPDGVVTGINSPNLVIDPHAVAEIEKSLYARFRNVGIGISVFGLLLALFNFVTPPINRTRV